MTIVQLTNSERPVADAGEKYINAIVNEQREMDDFFESNFSYY